MLNILGVLVFGLIAIYGLLYLVSFVVDFKKDDRHYTFGSPDEYSRRGTAQENRLKLMHEEVFPKLFGEDEGSDEK